MNKYAFGLLLLSTSALAQQTDYKCFDDCSARGYMFRYCQQVCTVHSQRQQIRPASPVDAFIRGQQARQESDMREIEIQRMQAETRRFQQENERRLNQLRKEREAEEERARLKAENEALQKKLKELEAKNP